MLSAISAALTEEDDQRTVLVTFDGLRRELPVLALRCRASWRFNLLGLARLPTMDHLPLIDLLGAAAPVGSLTEVCLGLGIPADEPASAEYRGEAADQSRRWERDAARTFLVLLHEIAAARRSATTLGAGWRALSAHVEEHADLAPHLLEFRAPAMLDPGTHR